MNTGNLNTGKSCSGYTEEKARVIAVEKNCLWVEVFRSSTCGNCEANNVCGQGIMSRWLNRGSQCMRVLCNEGQAELYAVGQWVDIGVPDGVVMKSSLVAYLSPLAGMLFGGALMHQMYANDFAVLSGLASGFFAGLLLVRQYANRRRDDRRNHPQLLGLHRSTA